MRRSAVAVAVLAAVLGLTASPADGHEQPWAGELPYCGTDTILERDPWPTLVGRIRFARSYKVVERVTANLEVHHRVHVYRHDDYDQTTGLFPYSHTAEARCASSRPIATVFLAGR